MTRTLNPTAIWLGAEGKFKIYTFATTHLVVDILGYSTGAGFLTLFPDNLTTAPLVAASNYPALATFGYNRHYFVGLSPAEGTFKVLTQFTTDLILDASGYFAP
jgi:hypothetical protein